MPPHLNSNYQSNYSRNFSLGDNRYSKDQLLDLFRAHGESGTSNKHLSDLLIGTWNTGIPNPSSNGTWNRLDEFKENNNGPEVCWDYDGSVQPLGLIDMTDEEREV